MKSKKIEKTTISRYYYNRAHKSRLANERKIYCSYCSYHKIENNTNNWYGGYSDKIKYPNWKLVSRNKKQWMKKPIKKFVSRRYNNEIYTEIKW